MSEPCSRRATRFPAGWVDPSGAWLNKFLYEAEEEVGEGGGEEGAVDDVEDSAEAGD